MSTRDPDELATLARDVEAWADVVDPGDLKEIPIEDLRAITSLADTIHQAEAALAQAIERARRDGRSWSQIGTSLGVSKQAAQQRYGTHVGH